MKQLKFMSSLGKGLKRKNRNELQKVEDLMMALHHFFKKKIVLSLLCFGYTTSSLLGHDHYADINEEETQSLSPQTLVKKSEALHPTSDDDTEDSDNDTSKETGTPLLKIKTHETVKKIVKPLILDIHGLIPSRVKEIVRDHPHHMPSPIAPILIPYREDGNGKGAFYDHFTLQRSTHHPTVISYPTGQETTSALYTYARQFPGQLSYGTTTHPSAPQKRVPETLYDQTLAGLLVIPGYIRTNEGKETKRVAHQERLIREALRRGQPILAICGGSWQLYKILGGETRAVDDHSYGGGMVRLSETTLQVTHNKQIHRIIPEPTSLLFKAIGFKAHDDTHIPVNSVHWKAPDETKLPPTVLVSSYSEPDVHLAPNTRQGEPMNPEHHTIESFENRWGAPVMGIQWHPEAYNPTDSAALIPHAHINLLTYMAKAGDAYAKKQQMLRELKEVIQKCQPKIGNIA